MKTPFIIFFSWYLFALYDILVVEKAINQTCMFYNVIPKLKDNLPVTTLAVEQPPSSYG